MHSVSEEVYPGVICKWSSLCREAPKLRAAPGETGKTDGRGTRGSEGAKERIVEGYGERTGQRKGVKATGEAAKEGRL